MYNPALLAVAAAEYGPSYEHRLRRHVGRRHAARRALLADRDVAAGLPDLRRLLAVVPPAQHVLPWLDLLRDAYAIHDLPARPVAGALTLLRAGVGRRPGVRAAGLPPC